MKDFGAPARAAIEAGTALSVGAVKIETLPTALRVWGGFGDLVIDGETYVGVGDNGLVSATGGAVGSAEQNLTLELSGVESDNLALFNMTSLRRAPTVCRRLLFDSSGLTLLAAPIFARGRLDQAPTEQTPGGTATIRAMIEGAARGLGRGLGRMRTDADQRLINASDDGLKAISYAGTLAIYLGGKPPQTQDVAFSGGNGSFTPGPGMEIF